MKRFSKLLSVLLSLALTITSFSLTITNTFAKDSLRYFPNCIETKNYITPATTKADGKSENRCTVCDTVVSSSKILRIKDVTLSKTSYTYDGKAKKPSVTVKDSKGNKIDKKYYTVTYAKGRKNIGKYKVTIKFKGNYSGTVTKYFTVNPKISLSKTSYTYDGKTKKPSVTVKDSKGNKINKKYYTVSYSKGRKNVGKYTVTIKFKGKHSGKYTKTYTIKPKGTSINKLTAKKAAFTVKWKKQSSQTTGYQIQYSTDKNFKKNNKLVTISSNKTTSKTISNLSSKKKYYVRIRSYKTVKIDGKKEKIYSSWSKVKNVTTKSAYKEYNYTVNIPEDHKHQFPNYPGKMFDTQKECEDYFEQEITKWDNMLENGEISYDEYYKNCPWGYEIYRCTCGKRFIVFSMHNK